MLAKWTPFPNDTQPTSALAPVLDTFFKDPFFSDLGFTAPWSVASAALQLPQTDIVETEEQLQLKVDLPGHDPKSMQVKLEGDTLTLQSERKSESQQNGANYVRSERTHGVFARSFVLPATVDGSKCQAAYEHGVLTLTMPKREEAKPRAIEVQVRG